MPPSIAVAGFSINPLYACLASSVKHPYSSVNEGNRIGKLWDKRKQKK